MLVRSSSCRRRSLHFLVIAVLPMMKFTTISATAQVVGTSGSLIDNSLDLSQARLAMKGAVSETEDLLRQNLLLSEQVRSITAALAQSRIEADAAAAENKTLNLRIEALGLDAASADRSKIEQRLIKALGDLRLAQNDAAKSRETVAGLTAAVLTALKTAANIDPEARMALEAQLRTATQNLGYDLQNVAKAEPIDPSLTNARVISIKPELGLVVGNLGARQGVKIGMPFQVWNGGQQVALAHVVDVRDNIFGALIQDQLSSEAPLKIGQRLKVATENPQ